MTTTLSAPLRCVDAIALPASGDLLEGRARREDVYPVEVTASADATADAVLRAVGGSGSDRVGVIADTRALELHGGPLLATLQEAGVELEVLHVAPGEPSKSLAEATRLLEALAGGSHQRRDLLLNLGGGVVCDLGGWVASAYMRGLPYVNVPTTLLAQVDGALGGKVGVNHAVAKNLLGGFHQPERVVADVSVLDTLPRRHVAAGIAECVKKAVIASPALWALLDAQVEPMLDRSRPALERLVRAAVAIKTELVARDPYERDLRRPLNFGHTIGHPLETVAGYGTLLHGEAVALGMVVETRIAAGRGLCDERLCDDLVALLLRCELPVSAGRPPQGLDRAGLLRAMEKVRQIRAGNLLFVLPVALGETIVADDVTDAEIESALASCEL